MPGIRRTDKKRTLDDVIRDREILDRNYHRRSEKLTTEFEELMAEEENPDEEK